MSEPGIPPIGPVLGVARHLERCPLCGGPNRALGAVEPAPALPPVLPSPPKLFRLSTETPASPPPPVVESPRPTPPPEEPRVVRPPSVPARTPPAARPVAAAPVRPLAASPEFALLDHPYIGGKLTVCVLCYGPYTHLAQRCLNSIVKTLPAERMSLRVATNEVPQETLDYLKTLKIDALYVNQENRLKYPVMREMFWDPEKPLRTSYVVWFDDDSHAVDPKWAIRLAEAIIANHQQGCRLYGIHFLHDLSMHARDGHRPDAWFRSASWWNGIHFYDRNRKPAPNGSVIHFAAGGFIALGVDAIQRGDIPDRRLVHNGGDITIGEQVHQAGFQLKMFNKDKAFVLSSGHARRGYREPFPWAKPGDADTL